MSSKGIAIVTGSARGIGRAIALRLADDGFDVAVNDIAPNVQAVDAVVSQIREKGRRSTGVLGDVSKEEDVKTMVEVVVKVLGGLDVMVANAGIAIFKPLSETTVDEWDRLYAINTRGTFLCFKYAAEHMVSQGRGGRMIAACSVSSKKGFVEQTLYASSKFAVRGIVQCAALEYGKYGITVNGYAPGNTETDMLRGVVEQRAKKEGVTTDEWMEHLRSSVCMRRNGTPEDVANVASFLAAPEASFITGQSVLVDGGWLFD